MRSVNLRTLGFVDYMAANRRLSFSQRCNFHIAAIGDSFQRHLGASVVAQQQQQVVGALSQTITTTVCDRSAAGRQPPVVDRCLSGGVTHGLRRVADRPSITFVASAHVIVMDEFGGACKLHIESCLI